MLTSPVCTPHYDGTMVINGARYATGAHTAVNGSLKIADGKILRFHTASITPCTSEVEMDLAGFLLLPGFINAHDHLQYALHPRLGNPPYRNYVEWGDDIHATMPSVISHFNSVPRNIRLLWGGIRNLLCGVTTVCHHDSPWPVLHSGSYPVKVLRNYGWAHSPALSPDIRQSWMTTPAGSAFFVHGCEGIDAFAQAELGALDKLGVLDADTVIVHGLALDDDGIALLQKRHASLIICLSSNHFLYEHLPDVNCINKLERVALGNDSPLTAIGDLLDEVRFALNNTAIPSEKAYRMITDIPSAILHLTAGEGNIRESACADLVAIRDNGDPPHARLQALSWRDVEFVMIAGEVNLASDDVWSLLPLAVKQGMEPLWIEGRIRWLRAPIQRILQQAEACLGVGMVRLSGRVIDYAKVDKLQIEERT